MCSNIALLGSSALLVSYMHAASASEGPPIVTSNNIARSGFKLPKFMIMVYDNGSNFINYAAHYHKPFANHSHVYINHLDVVLDSGH